MYEKQPAKRETSNDYGAWLRASSPVHVEVSKARRRAVEGAIPLAPGEALRAGRDVCSVPSGGTQFGSSIGLHEEVLRGGTHADQQGGGYEASGDNGLKNRSTCLGASRVTAGFVFSSLGLTSSLHNLKSSGEGHPIRKGKAVTTCNDVHGEDLVLGEASLAEDSMLGGMSKRRWKRAARRVSSDLVIHDVSSSLSKRLLFDDVDNTLQPLKKNKCSLVAGEEDVEGGYGD
ncbi:hypothetical protein ACOSQ3_018641 [Xanthoceras sorbifolium]